MKYRNEKDSIGRIKVPSGAYYGSFTARAQKNFQVSGITAPDSFRKALGMVKKAAALTNKELKEIEGRLADAIVRAADEFIDGAFNDEFTLDVFQAGAGTPFNMNANEIIANRANELLGGKKGEYKPVTPNNHVNWAQSSNDVIPTSIRIAALMEFKKLLPEVENLAKTFQKKAQEYRNVLKIGRTHLQDAVPVRFGQEFEAYASALHRSAKIAGEAFSYLREVSIGGTAVGTAITAHPKYRALMTKNLSGLTGFRHKATRVPMELTHSMQAFSVASASLRSLSNELVRIANDIKLMVSGPHGGLAEIILPEVEPGSSVMPGKVNPSIAECVTMVCFQVAGNDTAINYGVQAGQLELNVMTPMIMHNLLSSINLLKNACRIFREHSIKGLKVNIKRTRRMLDESLCVATGLSPYLGYAVTAELVKEALKKGLTLKEEVMNKKFMNPGDFEKILSPEILTGPGMTDKALAKKIRKNPQYREYLKKIT